MEFLSGDEYDDGQNDTDDGYEELLAQVTAGPASDAQIELRLPEHDEFVEPGHEDDGEPSPVELVRLQLQSLDWYYSFTDDSSVYRTGETAYAAAIAALGQIDETEAQALWSEYAPADMPFPLKATAPEPVVEPNVTDTTTALSSADLLPPTSSVVADSPLMQDLLGTQPQTAAAGPVSACVSEAPKGVLGTTMDTVRSAQAAVEHTIRRRIELFSWLTIFAIPCTIAALWVMGVFNMLAVVFGWAAWIYGGQRATRTLVSVTTRAMQVNYWARMGILASLGGLLLTSTGAAWQGLVGGVLVALVAHALFGGQATAQHQQ
jgi:hypothetical protein